MQCATPLLFAHLTPCTLCPTPAPAPCTLYPQVQQQLVEKNSRAVRALRQEEESREREISERKAEHAAKGRERVSK